jgi:hypothetical protein
MKAAKGSEGTAPFILKLGTKWTATLSTGKTPLLNVHVGPRAGLNAMGITNECKIMQVKTQQLYYVMEIRRMTTCFGLYTYFSWAIIRSNLSN